MDEEERSEKNWSLVEKVPGESNKEHTKLSGVKFYSVWKVYVCTFVTAPTWTWWQRRSAGEGRDNEIADCLRAQLRSTISMTNCPVYTHADEALLAEVSFWMEGVVQTSLAVFGILFNCFSSVILASREMRNSFNLLLIALACFDSCYLFGSILESMRKCFGVKGTLCHRAICHNIPKLFSL